VRDIKYRISLISLILIAILMRTTACSKMSSSESHGESYDSDGVPFVIDVQIQSIPGIMNSGQPVEIEAKVTQGSENVNDAKEVEFELWRRGQQDHEMIDAKSQGKGIYRIEKTFAADGIYYVIAHVAARDMHNMPLKELIVGEVTDKELADVRSGKKETSHYMP
jgi:hypothetical protein